MQNLRGVSIEFLPNFQLKAKGKPVVVSAGAELSR